MTEVFCTVSQNMVEIPENLLDTAEVKMLMTELRLITLSIGQTPCAACTKYQGQINRQKIEDQLSATIKGPVDARVNVTGEYEALLVPHEDNPIVPNKVKVREYIVTACSPQII